MLDTHEFRENATRCMAEAAQTTDPILKERLTETAQGWMRLAADLANHNAILGVFWRGGIIGDAYASASVVD
jgi:hypothetical protein